MPLISKGHQIRRVLMGNYLLQHLIRIHVPCGLAPRRMTDSEGLPHRCFQLQGVLSQPQEPMPSSGLLPTFEE